MLSFSRVRILWFLSVFCLPFFSSSLLLQRTFYPSEYIKDVQELISSAELYVPEGSSIMFDHPQVVFWETTSLQLATNRNVVTLAPYDNYLNTLKEGIHREAWIRYIYKDFDRKDYDLANHGAMTTDELLVSIYKSADIFHYQYLLLKQKPIKELTTRMQSDPVLRKAPCQYLIITKPEFMNIKIETEEVIIKPLWVSHAKIFEIAEVTEKDI
jgi:hypothetical protein